MKGFDLKELVESQGKEVCQEILMEGLEEPVGSKDKLNPSDFSFLELWEAFVGPVSKTLSIANRKKGYVELTEDAIDSTIYQELAGKIVANSVIEGYNRVSSIGDMLVQTMQTRNRYDKMPGWTPTEGLKTVKEGEPYEDTGAGFKHVGTGEVVKKGRILPLTEESVFYDTTGMILDLAKQLGEDARLDRERVILRAVLGLTQAYFPQDVPTSFFTAAGPQFVGSNPLEDWRNIETSELALADATDEENNTIVVTPKVMLVPIALKRTAMRILGATEIREQKNESAGTPSRETISNNPVQNEYSILSSPLIHKLQVDAGQSLAAATSNWFFGDPMRQFVWKEIWPLQTFRAREGNDDEFNRDVITKFKIRYLGGIFSRDFQYWQKNQTAAIP